MNGTIPKPAQKPLTVLGSTDRLSGHLRNSRTPTLAADFKACKIAALNFLKGQVMKLSKGKANPAVAGEILERKMKGDPGG